MRHQALLQEPELPLRFATPITVGHGYPSARSPQPTLGSLHLWLLSIFSVPANGKTQTGQQDLSMQSHLTIPSVWWDFSRECSAAGIRGPRLRSSNPTLLARLGASEIASYSTTPHSKREVAWRPVLAREDQDGNPRLLDAWATVCVCVFVAERRGRGQLAGGMKVKPKWNVIYHC